MPQWGASTAKEAGLPRSGKLRGPPRGPPLPRGPSTLVGQPPAPQPWPHRPGGSVCAWVLADPRPPAITFHFKKLKK